MEASGRWQAMTHILEFLAYKDPNKEGEYIPGLAVSWKLSANRMQFDLQLRKGVRWHDGEEFSAEDVKFSFDMHFDTRYESTDWAPMFAAVKKVQVLNSHKVRVHFKKADFRGYQNVLGMMRIFPKHYYEKADRKQWSRTLVGTGPYKVHQFKKGRRLRLKFNKDWWGRRDPFWKDKNNFPEVVFRYVTEITAALELMNKGKLDFFSIRYLSRCC